ncbi:MAG: hypothetical protein DMG87_21655 [Acidobacteria bacterium]|nr:MAG: hypothetical protein DMG87_21655 [Acidobacteriota bacterium]
MKSPLSLIALLVAAFLFSHLAFASDSQSPTPAAKTRLAIVGLDHDHVWELLKYIAAEPEADLVAIADPHPNLVNEAKSQVPKTVRFYSDYVNMLDEAKPEAVFVTTANDRHLEILRECAKRHIHYSTEKPMATNAADAREMQRLADQAGIKLMVNYWNAWTASSHDLFHRVKAGEIGPVQKIIVQYGHQGPKEIGVSKEFADWLYDPVKNGGGAIMDFGCYGAEWALWLKGRPTRVYATTRKLKAGQHNNVDDDATIVLDYPDATVVVEASWDWPYNMDRVYVGQPACKAWRLILPLCLRSEDSTYTRRRARYAQYSPARDEQSYSVFPRLHTQQQAGGGSSFKHAQRAGHGNPGCRPRIRPHREGGRVALRGISNTCRISDAADRAVRGSRNLRPRTAHDVRNDARPCEYTG